MREEEAARYDMTKLDTVRFSLQHSPKPEIPFSGTPNFGSLDMKSSDRVLTVPRQTMVQYMYPTYSTHPPQYQPREPLNLPINTLKVKVQGHR